MRNQTDPEDTEVVAAAAVVMVVAAAVETDETMADEMVVTVSETGQDLDGQILPLQEDRTKVHLPEFTTEIWCTPAYTIVIWVFYVLCYTSHTMFPMTVF